jgi:signal transduction histidine kinase
MQDTLHKSAQVDPSRLPQRIASQGSTATQLGVSHILAAGAALGIYAWLTAIKLQQPYPLILALATACIIGLFCTLNLQYSLYLLEITLYRLAHSQPVPNPANHDYKKYLAWRWPLSSLFLRLQDIEQRIQHYIINEQLTADLREKALQQAGEAAAQAERNRIARELHDSIKQQIFSISVSAAAAKAHWQSEDSGDAREAVEDIQRSAKEAQVEMQALLQQLRPAPLENISLVDALNVQAQALGFRTGAQMHVEIGEMPGNDRLLPGTQEAIFRQVQEAFANIARHARASNIWLAVCSDERELHIEVRDDGQGFEMAHAHKGMGLNNLHERAQELHGKVEITSQPGQGTNVAITIPLLETLSDPEEEARHTYELMRNSELAQRGYQLCNSFAPLSIFLIVIAGFNFISISWIIIVLCTLVAVYGYASGLYYRTQVALSTGQQSLATLTLKQQSYMANRRLIRMFGLGAWYAFFSLRLLEHPTGLWSIVGILAGMLVTSQLVRRNHYRDINSYYHLISAKELRWELERRRQQLNKSLGNIFMAAVAAFFLARAFLVFPPLSAGQWFNYGVALLFLTVSVGLYFDYRQLWRWQDTLNKREQGSNPEEVAHG